MGCCATLSLPFHKFLNVEPYGLQPGAAEGVDLAGVVCECPGPGCAWCVPDLPDLITVVIDFVLVKLSGVAVVDLFPENHRFPLPFPVST